jgi:hypothetical protein
MLFKERSGVQVKVASFIQVVITVGGIKNEELACGQLMQM